MMFRLRRWFAWFGWDTDGRGVYPYWWTDADWRRYFAGDAK